MNTFELLNKINDSGIGFWDRKDGLNKRDELIDVYTVFFRHNPDNVNAQYYNLRVLQDTLKSDASVIKSSVSDSFDSVSCLAVLTFKRNRE